MIAKSYDMFSLFPSRRVALEVFGFPIHWYGIMYLLAFLLAYFLLPRLQRQRGVSLLRDDWATVLSWGVIGVLVGGRLGYVLFYAPELLLRDPLEVLKVWHGGMSSHGGFLGVLLAVGLYLWRRRMPLLLIADLAVVPVALGLALGRLGNFINLELFGTVTDLPWAIAVPGVEGLRHPAQFYAMGKDLLIAAVCYWHLVRVRPVIPGHTTALFLMLYGTLRFLVEYVRVQEYPLIGFGVLSLSRGQLLTLPIVLVGVVLWRVARW